MNDSIKFILTVIISTIVVFAIIIFICTKVKEKREREYIELIKQNSYRIKKLENINRIFKYEFDYNYTEDIGTVIHCNSKAQLDRFDYEKHAKDYIADRKEFILTFMKVVNQNRKTWNEYSEQVKTLPMYMTKEESESLGIPYDFCKLKEKELFKDTILKVNLKPELVIAKSYVSPQGRSNYNLHISYSFEEVLELYRDVLNIEKKKETAQYQRSLMTPKLRFDVMRRDGFRCKYCGRTEADGVKLHVDHIKPVSKGGKTELSNLQTLCDECNLGKSDFYEFD